MPEQTEPTLAERRTSSRFSMVPEPLSFDPAVSMAAKGFWALLLCLAAPGTSTFRTLEGLAELGRCKASQVKRLRAELIANGYLSYEQSMEGERYTVLRLHENARKARRA